VNINNYIIMNIGLPFFFFFLIKKKKKKKRKLEKNNWIIKIFKKYLKMKIYLFLIFSLLF